MKAAMTRLVAIVLQFLHVTAVQLVAIAIHVVSATRILVEAVHHVALVASLK
jgi:hypothetical protein